MFRDAYKNAHKEITPDKALLQNILEMAEKESSKTKKGKIIRFYPYLSAAAAVFLIAVSSVIYTNLLPEQPITENNNVVVKNIQENRNAQIEDSSPITDKPLKTQKTEPLKSKSNDSSEHVYEKNAPSAAKQESSNNQNSSNESAVNTEMRVLMNINNLSSSAKDDVTRSGAIALSEFDNEEVGKTMIEYWSANEYSAYTGFDIKNDISVPDDMMLFENEEFLIEKDSRTNEIISDENSYYFEKDYQRFIIVSTSKNKEEAESFLDETKYQITNINGSSSTITFDGNLYNVYLIKSDLAIKLTAGGISEQELEKIIISITERN